MSSPQNNNNSDIINSPSETFENIIELINSMHQETTIGQTLFDPRRLVFGELEDDDEEVAIENTSAPEHTIVPLEVRGTAVMPTLNEEAAESEEAAEEAAESEEDSEYSNSDESIESEIHDCCVCYKTKTALRTLVLPNCGHIICQTCFFRWLRTSPTCPMCRDNFTSWDRVSEDTIKNDVYELTNLFNSVSRKHNSISHQIEDLRETRHNIRRKNGKLREENFNIKKENTEIMSTIVRRREYSDYIRGYNGAIMMGSLKNHEPLKTKHYLDGFTRGLCERDNFLKTLDIDKKDICKVQPQLLKIIEDWNAEKKFPRRQIVIRRKPGENLNLDLLFENQDTTY